MLVYQRAYPVSCMQLRFITEVHHTELTNQVYGTTVDGQDIQTLQHTLC